MSRNEIQTSTDLPHITHDGGWAHYAVVITWRGGSQDFNFFAPNDDAARKYATDTVLPGMLDFYKTAKIDADSFRRAA